MRNLIRTRQYPSKFILSVHAVREGLEEEIVDRIGASTFPRTQDTFDQFLLSWLIYQLTRHLYLSFDSKNMQLHSYMQALTDRAFYDGSPYMTELLLLQIRPLTQFEDSSAYSERTCHATLRADTLTLQFL